MIKFSMNNNRSVNKIKLVFTSKYLSDWSSSIMIIGMIENRFNYNRKRSIRCMNIIDITRSLKRICNRMIDDVPNTTNHNKQCASELKRSVIQSWSSLTWRRNEWKKREKCNKLALIEINLMNWVNYKRLYIASCNL